MRVVAAVVLAALLIGVTGASAQERTIEYTTSVEPELYVFDQQAYQRDANGDRVRDEEGRYKLEPQYVTLHVEVRMECAVQPDGHEVAFFADGPRVHLKNASTNEVESTYLDLEPREFNLTWRQDQALGDWVASDVLQIQILSNAKPTSTIEGEFTWFIDRVDIPQACPQDSQAPDVTPHTIIIPGFDFDPDDFNLTEDDLPGGVETPAPGLALAVGAIGLAAAVRRRQE